jgi:hypothetical protein
MIRLAVVIILLLIPATDWLTPGLCPEDLQGMPMVAVMDQSCVAQRVTSPTLAEQEHHPQKSNSPQEDECFCCCHHVVPQLIFISSDDKTSVGVTPEALEDLVSPTSDPPYHPPKFS